MHKSKNIEVTLVAEKKLIESIYYGSFSCYWWVPRNESAINTEFIPIRVGQKTCTFLNGREFIVRVVVGNKGSAKQPGYCCESGTFSSNVEIQLQKLFQICMCKFFKLKQENQALWLLAMIIQI